MCVCVGVMGRGCVWMCVDVCGCVCVDVWMCVCGCVDVCGCGCVSSSYWQDSTSTIITMTTTICYIHTIHTYNTHTTHTHTYITQYTVTTPQNTHTQESEGEEAQEARVQVPEGTERLPGLSGKTLPKTTRVQLTEVGPRIELEVIKVEEGLAGGKVLYHKYVDKSKEEVVAQQAEHDDREKLRAQRRRQQV